MSKGKLTGKQELFCVYYIDTLNATEAARRAGYKGSYATLRSIGSQNLTKLNIKARIAELMAEKIIPQDEVLVRLSLQATSSIGDFITIDKDGWRFDFKQFKSRGHLIKSIKQGQYGTEIRLHDSQEALVQLGKHYGLFTERMVLRWEEEAERAGIPASALFERMVAEIMMELQEQHAGDED